YVFVAEDRQHVVYRGVDGHIHELGYTLGANQKWGHFDLSAATGAPAAAGDPNGYVFVAEDRQHVGYRGVDGHIPELGDTLGANEKWGHFDLSAAMGAPAPAGALFGYTTLVGSRQHVVYRGVDGHIHELGYTLGANQKWGHFDLSAATGAPAAAGDPNGYVFVAED